MADIMRRVGREVLVIDGAMGTMLQRASIPSEQSHEQLNVTAPDLVEEIHRNYVMAGADCVTTNTFGGTRAKLDEFGLGDQVVGLNRAAVRLAKRSGALHVLADVGPTGLVMEPLGGATFDQVFALFAEQAAALADEQPDAILIETMTDIAEARCALLAARSVTDLPVFVTMTFGLSGRTDLSGTPPEAAAVVLEACGASAVGINCGLGPDQMLPLIERMVSATSLPVIAQPNAGLPRLEDGATVFPGTPAEMGEFARRAVEAGASFVGSCCGSSPGFTGEIADLAKPLPPRQKAEPSAGVVVAGPRGVARIGGGGPLVIIGERINPTGKKALADSLREGSMAVVREYAVEQQHAGADLLDVNVGAAGVDETKSLPEAVRTLIGLSDLPLVLDNKEPEALEPALRLYPGRALINSVDGTEESMAAVLPLAARYGAAVVVLALDDAGIPDTWEGRVEIVERIRDAAHAHGLTDRDLVVDCLAMTAATDPFAVQQTLAAVRRVTDMGLETVLGVSNVSHGLPGRAELNAAFLEMAVAEGLSAAIVNPLDREVAGSSAAIDVLTGADRMAERWIKRVQAEEAAGQQRGGGEALAQPLQAPQAPKPASEGLPATARAALRRAVETGDHDSAPALVDALVALGTAPGDIIGDVLTPAIQHVGDLYGIGDVFLPQLMASADAMKAAVGRAKSHLPEGAATRSAGRVAFATVKGDIHSIGKDICVSLLESHGFAVEDLGVDVGVEQVVATARDVDAVCLSALMTTTLRGMEATVEALRPTGVPVIVGGAVVTADYAASIGALYAGDAPACVEMVRSALAGSGR